MSTILTQAERQIAELILRGHSRREIAKELGKDVRILTKHLSGMYSKLTIAHDRVHSRFMLLALLIHERRAELGVKCEACEDSMTESSP